MSSSSEKLHGPKVLSLKYSLVLRIALPESCGANFEDFSVFGRKRLQLTLSLDKNTMCCMFVDDVRRIDVE